MKRALFVSFVLGSLPVSACEIIPVGFSNVLPAGTSVSIIEIEAKITYEPSVESFPPRRVDLKPQSKEEVFLSQCTTKCAKKIWGKMTVLDTQGGGSKTTVREKTYEAPPGQCFPMQHFRLGKS